MKAIAYNTIVAEAPKQDLIRIEGNWYFPPSAIKREHFRDNDMHTVCFWKGRANYYDVVVNGEVIEGGAWYYPHPIGASFKIIGKDFTDYVAFWRGVSVEE